MNQNTKNQAISMAVGNLQCFYPELTTEALSKLLAAKPQVDTATIHAPVTRAEAAKMLSVSKSSIDRYLNRGMLKRINIKGTRLVRIDYSSVEQLLEESPQGVA